MKNNTKKRGILALALLLALSFMLSAALPCVTAAAEKGFTGLKIVKNKYVYYTDGKVDKKTKTLARVNGKGPWYFVQNGTVNRKKNGLFKYNGKLFYIKNGKWNKKFKGLYKKGNVLYYFTKGVQNKTFKGLVKYGKNWLYVENGVWNKKYNGMARIKGYPKPFKVKKGKVKGGMVVPSAKLAKQVEKIMKKNGIRTLKGAFRWACCTYVNYDADGSLGLAHYANYGLRHHYGNCYVMAAIFCVMARELGYEAYEMTGSVPGLYVPLTPHSWVEVKVDGQWYVCDPDLTIETGTNGFLIHYGTRGSYVYTNYKRMGD